MNLINIVLRTSKDDTTPCRELTIESTRMEVFTDRVEGYNEDYGHFYIGINNGYFLAGHLPCCEGWQDETACFDLCIGYAA